MAGIRDEDILLFAPAQKSNKKSQGCKKMDGIYFVPSGQIS